MRFGSAWAGPFLAVDWCYRLPPARAVQIYDVKNNRQRNSLYDAEHTQELLKWSRTYLAKKGLTTERQLRVRALCSTDAFSGADASCAITGTNQRTSFTCELRRAVQRAFSALSCGVLRVRATQAKP